MVIVFENIPEHYPSPERLRVWLQGLASHYNTSLQRVNYRFVGSAQMLVLNQKHLQHDTHTDILTFDYSSAHACAYEAIINIDMLEYNAKKYNESTDNELIRLLSHAFFHVIGFKDKTPTEQQGMRIAETKAIAMFHVKPEEHV